MPATWEARLRRLQAEDPRIRFYLYDGYYHFGYGEPDCPVLISNSDGLFLLRWVSRRHGGDLFSDVQKSAPPIILAEPGSREFEALRGNRFLYLGICGGYPYDEEEFIPGRERVIDRTPFDP